MPKRSLFNQLTQNRGSLSFEDLRSYIDLAEITGRHYLSGTLTVTSGSATVTDSSNVFNKHELGNFVVIDAGPAAGVYTITSSGTLGDFNASVSPIPSATDPTATYRRHYYQNLEDDLNYLRTMLNLIVGETNWYDEPDTDLTNLSSDLSNNYYTSSQLDSGQLDNRYYTETEVDILLTTISGGGGTSNNFYDADVSYVSDTQWTYGAGFPSVPTALAIYVNGIKQRIGASYDCTVAVPAGVLTITFNYNVYSSDWVNITYII